MSGPPDFDKTPHMDLHETVQRLRAEREKLRGVLIDVLEAFNALPCDCGGSSMCVVCNASKALAEEDGNHENF